MSEKLLNCPFCGGEAQYLDPDDMISDDVEFIHVIACTNEQCHCEAASKFCQTKADAIAAWNTRSSVDISARIEAAAEEIRSVACIAWDKLPDGHWLKDVDDKLAAIIRRNLEVK